MHRRVLSSLLWAVLLPVGAFAADQPSLLGARVRAHVVGSDLPLVGTVVDADADSLVIRSSRENADIRVLREKLEGLDASRGVRRHTLHGVAAAALVWGAMVGLTAAFDTLDESGVGEPLLVGGLLVTGGIVGSLIKSERWETMPLGRVSLRLAPTRRGAQLQVVLAF